MNFYREAAGILDDLTAKTHGSLKSLIFNSRPPRPAAHQKRLYALLSETLKRPTPSRPKNPTHVLTFRKRGSGENPRLVAVTQA